jgi:hypothetical protein
MVMTRNYFQPVNLARSYIQNYIFTNIKKQNCSSSYLRAGVRTYRRVKVKLGHHRPRHTCEHLTFAFRLSNNKFSLIKRIKHEFTTFQSIFPHDDVSKIVHACIIIHENYKLLRLDCIRNFKTKRPLC